MLSKQEHIAYWVKSAEDDWEAKLYSKTFRAS